MLGYGLGSWDDGDDDGGESFGGFIREWGPSMIEGGMIPIRNNHSASSHAKQSVYTMIRQNQDVQGLLQMIRIKEIIPKSQQPRAASRYIQLSAVKQTRRGTSHTCHDTSLISPKHRAPSHPPHLQSP